MRSIHRRLSVLHLGSLVLTCLLLLLGFRAPEARAQTNFRQDPATGFSIRPGFQVSVVAENIQNARFLEFDDSGTLYVSRPGPGDILSLRDTDGDGVYETRHTFVSGYSTVHGLYFKDGWLWFTQTGSVHKARDTDGDGVADDEVTVIPEDKIYSQGGGHWWRSILVADDGIYTSIGDKGNITEATDSDREKIWKYSLDGNSKELFASGIRNTEKLRYRPGTQEVWGCDHGSDWFGRPLGEGAGRQPITDLNPPGEFNHYVQGGFYGHPYITGFRVPRIEYQDRDDIIDLAAKTIPPAWGFHAHIAPNGFTFVSLGNTQFPKDFRGDAFVAFHGSWNSSTRVGYGVQHVLFDSVTGKPYGAERVVTTLGPDGSTVLERPVDCVEAPDGSILFSGDARGGIYRITFTGSEQ